MNKKNEKDVEIPMEELKARQDDSPRPKPDGESMQEMLADDHYRNRHEPRGQDHLVTLL